MTLGVALSTPGALTFAADGMSVTESLGPVSMATAKIRSASGWMVAVAGIGDLDHADSSAWCIERLCAHADPSTAPYALGQALLALLNEDLADEGVHVLVGRMDGFDRMLVRVAVRSGNITTTSLNSTSSSARYGILSIGQDALVEPLTSEWVFSEMGNEDAVRMAAGLVAATSLSYEGRVMEKRKVGGVVTVEQATRLSGPMVRLQASSAFSAKDVADANIFSLEPWLEADTALQDQVPILVEDRRAHMYPVLRQEARELRALAAWLPSAEESFLDLKAKWKRDALAGNRVSWYDQREEVSALAPDRPSPDEIESWLMSEASFPSFVSPYALPRDRRVSSDLRAWDRLDRASGFGFGETVDFTTGMGLSQLYLLADIWRLRRRLLQPFLDDAEYPGRAHLRLPLYDDAWSGEVSVEGYPDEELKWTPFPESLLTDDDSVEVEQLGAVQAGVAE